jgi:protein-L-isoaspartate(D-aspartate) O-methyltransferase
VTDDWRQRAQVLVERLIAEDDLHSPAWRDALLNVPRHEFVPRYYEQDTTTCPARWVLREPHDKASTARWLDLVYSTTTLVTDVADYADRGIQIAVSSSTKPDLMVRMLEALDIQPGHRVLEIGTGTGYNAALLAHRLGPDHVFSVDVDPALVHAAGKTLHRLGYPIALATVDGASGLPQHAPYDRIIATCSLSWVPAACIDQLRPSGMILVDIEGPLGAGNLLALHRLGDRPEVQGRFLPWWGRFMRRRTTTGTTGTPRPAETSEPPQTRTSPVNPLELDEAFRFLAQLHLSAGTFQSIRMGDNHIPMTYLAAPDGSWCQVTRQPNHHGRFPLREAGPTRLWSAVETAWAQWTELGAPPWHDFGLTARPNDQSIWFRDPSSKYRWPLATGG